MGTKWYCYRNDETNMDLKLTEEKPELLEQGYRLAQVVDWFVDKKKAKVGGH